MGVAILLGSASASVSLDISNLMGNADTAMSKLDQLGSFDGSGSGPGFFDKMTSGALAFGTALLPVVGVGVTGMIQLEDATNNVAVSLGEVDPGILAELEDLFIRVGAASQFSAVEVANVSDAYAKAGFTSQQILGGMAESTVQLAQATGDGLGPATQAMISAFNIWNPQIVDSTIAMTDAAQAADILTVASNQSAGGIGDIVAGLTNVGPSAAAVQMSFADTAAAIAYFTNFGYSGGEAGTKLARSLQFLANPTAEAQKLLDQLGVSAFDVNGNFVGLPDLFDQLNKATADMTDEQRIAAFKTLFGAEGYDAMLIGAAAGGDGLRALRGEMDATGITAEQSALRMNTISAKLGELKESTFAFLTSLMSGLKPGFHAVLDFANGVINALMNIPDGIKTVIGAFAGMLAGFALITRSIQGFQALSGLMSMLSGSTAATAVSTSKLALVFTRFIPVVGLVTGAFLAWQRNFLGFRDAIAAIPRAFDGVMSFFDRFASAFKKVESPARKVTATFEKMTKPIDGLRKGFNALVDFASDVAEPFKALADRGAAFGDAVGRLLGPLESVQSAYDKAAGAAAPLIDSVSTLARVFDSLAYAIRGINGGEIPSWLSDIASAFEFAADATDTFFEAFSDGLDFAQLNGISGIDRYIEGLKSAFSTIDIPAIAIRVGSWLISAAQDLWGAVTSWVSDVALPAAGEAARTIWNVAVNIGSWAKGTISDLWPYVTQWASDAMSFATDAAGTLWGVVVNIGSWAQGIVSDIWPYISNWATDAWDAVSSTAVTIWGVLVNVGSWGIGELSDLWGFIERNVRIEYSKRPEDGILLAGTKITLGGFEVEFSDPLELISKVNAKIDEALTPDEGQESAIRDKGRAYGERAFSAFMGAFSGGFGDGGGGGGFTFLKLPHQYIQQWVSPWFEEFFGGFVSEAEKHLGDLPSIDISMPDINWPDLPDFGTVPFVTDMVEMFGNIGDMFSRIEWSFDIKLPSISWPGVDAVLDTLPQWLRDFATMNPIDWVKKWIGGGDEDEDDGGAGGGGERGFGNSLKTPALQLNPDDYDISPILGNIQMAKDKLTELQGVAAQVGPAIGTAMSGTTFDTSGISTAVNAAKESFNSLTIQAQLTTLAINLAGREVGEAFGNGVASGVTASAGTVGSAVTGLMTTAGGYQLGFGIAGTNVGRSFGVGTAAGIRSQSGSVGSAVSALLSTASGYTLQATFAGGAIGRALGAGIAAGIRSQIGAVAAEAANIVSAAIGAAKAAGAIASPSRVMRDEVGRMLGLGAALGVEDMYPRMASAMAGLVSIPVANSAPNVGYGGGGGTTVIHQTTISAPVTVEGNVTTEDTLLDTFVERFSEGVEQRVRQRNVALGVSQ